MLKKDAAEYIQLVFDSRTTTSIQCDFLANYQSKPVNVAELTGMVEDLQKLCRPLPLSLARPHQVLVSGTGGDKQNLFNITTIAVIIAGAVDGVAVIKTSGPKTTSKSGGVDVMAHLGINPPKSAEQITKCADRFGLALVPSHFYCPALANIRVARESFAGPTIINMIAPLLNPFKLKRFACGVWSYQTAYLMAAAAKRLGFEAAYLYCGHYDEKSLDEISPSGRSQIMEAVKNTAFMNSSVEPSDFGLAYHHKLEDFQVNSPAESAKIIKAVLAGKECLARRPAVMNAAMILYATGKTTDLIEATELACQAIDSGKALSNLNGMIEFLN